jgi:predicted RND superfamily exporter protein
VQHGFLSPDGDREVWRLSVRVEALNDMEYDQVLAAIEARVNLVLVRRKLDTDVVRPVYTGLLPLAQVGQEELLSGLFKSFCLALAMIAIVMMLLLRSVLAGLLAMLPNVFPTLITFGTMGWAATYVDIGAMMTASVALGIAVDDTLHFLAWFRRARAEGKSRHEAIEFSFQRCASAMMQTTLIAGLGLLVFFLSSFQPISQFGLLMCVLLVSALVGDLVFLPALLATRLGNYFARTKDSSEARTRKGAD